MFDKLIGIIQQAGKAILPFTVINEYDAAILLRFGKFKKVLPSGLRFKIPFVDATMRVDSRTRFYQTSKITMVTVDGVELTISVIMAFKSKCPKTAILSHTKYGSPVWDGTVATVSKLVQAKTYAEVVSPDFSDLLLKQSRIENEKYGIEMVSCRLQDVVKSRTFRLMND